MHIRRHKRHILDFEGAVIRRNRPVEGAPRLFQLVRAIQFKSGHTGTLRKRPLLRHARNRAFFNNQSRILERHRIMNDNSILGFHRVLDNKSVLDTHGILHLYLDLHGVLDFHLDFYRIMDKDGIQICDNARILNRATSNRIRIIGT